MKKSDIVALGIDEELASKIVEMAEAELKGNYIPMSRFNEVNEAKKNAEALVKERDGQLETLRSSAGNADTLKKQIEDLQGANAEAKKQYEASLRQMKIDHDVDSEIAARQGKNAKAIRALLDMGKVNIAEDGTITGLSDQMDALVKDEGSSFMFQSTVPSVKGYKPAGDQGGAKEAKPDLSKMSYTEICDYLATNPDAKLE